MTFVLQVVFLASKMGSIGDGRTGGGLVWLFTPSVLCLLKPSASWNNTLARSECCRFKAVPEGHWLNELLTAAQYGYRMSKAALNCGGATMARDLKGDGIAVALIHPGAVSCPVKFNLMFSNQGENADRRNSASAKGRRKGCLATAYLSREQHLWQPCQWQQHQTCAVA